MRRLARAISQEEATPRSPDRDRRSEILRRVLQQPCCPLDRKVEPPAPAIHRRGVWGGGSDFTPTYFASVNGITFSTETAVILGNRLSLARNTTGVNSSTRLYFGGNHGHNQSMIDGIRFVPRPAITASATLATVRRGHAGVNSSTKGYFMGGFWTPMF